MIKFKQISLKKALKKIAKGAVDNIFVVHEFGINQMKNGQKAFLYPIEEIGINHLNDKSVIVELKIEETEETEIEE